MVDRLVAIYDRLNRADDHFNAIKEQLLTYYEYGLGSASGEFNPNGDGEFVIRGTISPPAVRLHTLVGEFLHDLRSSLDHLAWQLVEANGGTPTKGTFFPILEPAPAANEKRIRPPASVHGGVSATALALIEDAQPYKWQSRYAEHPLWILNQLWNVDKHRHVVAKGTRIEGFSLASDTRHFKFTVRVASFDVDGAELVLVPDDPSVNVDARTTFRIIVHEPGEGVVRPLHGALKDARMAALTIVRQAEDRCF